MSGTAPPGGLRALEKRVLECYFTRRSLEAGQLGFRMVENLLPPVATAAVDDLIDRYRAVAADVRRALSAGPDPTDRVTLQLMDEVCGAELDSLALHSNRFTVSPLPEAGLTSALLTFLPYADTASTQTREAYLRACAGVPAVLADYADELAVGTRENRPPVRTLVLRAVEQIGSYLATPPARDPFVGALAEGSTDRDTVRGIVDRSIRSAFGAIADDVLVPLMDSARDDEHAGLCWIAGGLDAYGVLIREHTTLAVEPLAVHRRGIELIAELEGQAERLGHRLHWSGGFADVRDRMRADPALRYRDARQMLHSAEEAMRRAVAQVPRWITDLPQATCEVRPMLDTETAHGVIGHYETAPLDRSRPAVYWLNTADPASRAAFEAEALAFHESVPGHHIEIATSQETVAASEFRRLVHVLPYTEGWALYAEQFADEIDLYSDDLARLGMLSFALWRSCRLVVDTGLHAFGWSRQRAIEYLTAHSMLAPQNIANEVDRYIAHPGSALGYMIGRLAIQKLRDASVRDVSDPVAVRAFHHGLLTRGPLTLNLLGELAGVDLTTV